MSDNPLRFYNPLLTSRTSTSRLPHLQQAGAVYFLTFRLADAVPAEPLQAFIRERDEWITRQAPRPWPEQLEKEFHRKFTGRFERWLDHGFGSCILRDRANARIVADTLQHFEGERSRLHAWVVMPNHVHVLASLVGDTSLADLLKSWKGFTARQINQRQGTNGSIWQKSYFDRIVRDEDHFEKCARYIRNNPGKAKLGREEFLQGESDLVRRIL